jgi:hypothetical protein
MWNTGICISFPIHQKSRAHIKYHMIKSISLRNSLVRGWLHERFRVRFHVRFAAHRRCDLVYMRFAVRKESLSNFFLHQIADAIWCAILCPLPLPFRAPNRTANRTANRRVCVNGSNSVSDTKLQMQQIASAIYSKSHMKSHTCNQPLSLIDLTLIKHLLM